MLQHELCNSRHIDDFLADRLNESQRLAFEQHLGLCEGCCQALEQRTAVDGLWQEAREYLSSAELPLSRELSQGIPEGSQRRLRLDFLSPTDDPRMLGRLAGYEISGIIGYGGMGIVLKAFDPALNRYAAIKVLAPHYATSEAARQRFARESQAAAAVIHDNVIAIHGVSEFNELPYLVMPYVKGESLQKRLDREGPLSIPEILRIAMQTARGLAAAHQLGLVHRDIKPGNILLPVSVERVIITDFGLARAADDASLTRSGIIAGTPQYMSPEQARGEGIDPRSDLFSLGSMMYVMCTGRPPFQAETPYGVLRKITDTQPAEISSINPDIPCWLCDVIERLLQKDAARRFDSAESVASLLEQCLAHVQRPKDVALPAELKPPTTLAARYIAVIACAAFTMAASVWTAVTPSPSAIGDPTQNVPGRVQSSEGARQDNHASGEPTIPLQTDLDWLPEDDIGRIEQSIRELNEEL